MPLFVNATRLPYLTAILVPVLLGGAVAFHDGYVNIPLLLITLVAVALFHLGSNAMNDYFDHLSGADEANQNPGPFFGGSRVIQNGLLKPRQVLALALALYALGSCLGFIIAFWSGHPVEVVLLGLIGIGIGVLYTAPPVQLVHHGIGEFFLGIAFGPLIVVGADFVLSGAWSLEALYASLPVALLIIAVLYINEIPDRAWDAQAGKRTVVARLPLRTAVNGYAVIMGVTYFVIAAGGVLNIIPLITLIALATLPLAWRAFTILRANYNAPYQMMPANAITIQIHLQTGLLLVATYVVVGLFQIVKLW
ncbi:MAG: prenyltransferase [Anaerolineae bacterium]